MIDVERAEVRGNAEWSAGMAMGELLRLASVATVAQMLEREDFRGRSPERAADQRGRVPLPAVPGL